MWASKTIRWQGRSAYLREAEKDMRSHLGAREETRKKNQVSRMLQIKEEERCQNVCCTLAKRGAMLRRLATRTKIIYRRLNVAYRPKVHFLLAIESESVGKKDDQKCRNRKLLTENACDGWELGTHAANFFCGFFSEEHSEHYRIYVQRNSTVLLAMRLVSVVRQ